MSRTHTLKTWPEPFAAIVDGRKRYEIRRDDRSFAVGDVLNLKEWDPYAIDTAYSYLIASEPKRGAFTGRECNALVTYMTPSGAWGLPAGLCVMSIEVQA